MCVKEKQKHQSHPCFVTSAYIIILTNPSEDVTLIICHYLHRLKWNMQMNLPVCHFMTPSRQKKSYVLCFLFIKGVFQQFLYVPSINSLTREVLVWVTLQTSSAQSGTFVMIWTFSATDGNTVIFWRWRLRSSDAPWIRRTACGPKAASAVQMKPNKQRGQSKI